MNRGSRARGTWTTLMDLSRIPGSPCVEEQPDGARKRVAQKGTRGPPGHVRGRTVPQLAERAFKDKKPPVDEQLLAHERPGSVPGRSFPVISLRREPLPGLVEEVAAGQRDGRLRPWPRRWIRFGWGRRRPSRPFARGRRPLRGNPRDHRESHERSSSRAAAGWHTRVRACGSSRRRGPGHSGRGQMTMTCRREGLSCRLVSIASCDAYVFEGKP